MQTIACRCPATLALFFLLVVGCGSGGGGKDDPICENTAADSLCAILSVPDSFSGTPVKISALGFDSLPPAGMPNAFFGDVDQPAIAPTRPFKLELSDITYRGTTNFYVALYMEGGGSMSPLSGVDYVGSAPDLTFDGTPIGLDPISLSLYQAP